MDSPLFCDRCSCQLAPGTGSFYVVNIEAVADPSPPAEPPEGMTSEMIRAQIEALMASVRELSEREALDQVYRRVRLSLCVPCFRQWIENPTGT
jgi:hypothetical protein